MGFEIKNAAVTLADGEQKRIEDAVDALAKDPHAPREMTLKVTLHIHNEYPKHLYKGKLSLVAQNEAEEEKAVADGYGKFVPVEEEAAS